MLDRINGLFEEAKLAIAKATTSESLYEVKVRYLGKQGSFSGILKEMGKLTPDDRKTIGKRANEVRDELESLYLSKESGLKRSELNSRLEKERLDITLPGEKRMVGSDHLVVRVTRELCEIFGRIGFSVRLGPHIEKDFFNFDALNIGPDHASRDMQDTFYIDDGVERKTGEFSPWILRTHTSPVQIRSMMTEKPPLRIMSPGGVYRSDSDVSHSPHFHQVEGFVVDENVSMADLKGTLGFFAREFFGSEVKVRLRPSFFPFVEPGAEFDASCPLCKQKGCSMCKGSGWIEIGGSGMIHPNVFKSAGIEYPKYNGFAFGMGIERIAIVKYGVTHIGAFTENDTRFLEQFRS
ncbi:MAG: phenylalanine--tRNA ligase subunit alpha [Oligoflexia bacterium]|nr:phenylalanine--tRNA ligase subunit alpha [Oligoflexia bacterium]